MVGAPPIAPAPPPPALTARHPPHGRRNPHRRPCPSRPRRSTAVSFPVPTPVLLLSRRCRRQRCCQRCFPPPHRSALLSDVAVDRVPSLPRNTHPAPLPRPRLPSHILLDHLRPLPSLPILSRYEYKYERSARHRKRRRRRRRRRRRLRSVRVCVGVARTRMAATQEGVSSGAKQAGSAGSQVCRDDMLYQDWACEAQRRARESHGWFITTAAQHGHRAPRWSSPPLLRRRSSPVVLRLLFGRRSVRSEGDARANARANARSARESRGWLITAAAQPGHRGGPLLFLFSRPVRRSARAPLPRSTRAPAGGARTTSGRADARRARRDARDARGVRARRALGVRGPRFRAPGRAATPRFCAPLNRAGTEDAALQIRPRCGTSSD